MSNDDDYDPAAEYDNSFRVSPQLRDLSSRGSKATIVEITDPKTGEITRKVKMTRKKFDADAQARFLNEYQKWGRMTESALAAGVTTQTVRAEIDRNPDFAEALMEAEGVYRDKLIAHHQDLVFNGIEKTNFDRNGNVVSRETQYPIPLIQMELRKHDEGYREKKEMSVQHGGGVLLAPSEMSSIEDWEAKFRDVTPKEEEE